MTIMVWALPLLLLVLAAAPIAGGQPSEPAPTSSAAPPAAPDADPRIAALEAARAGYAEAEGKPADEESLARIKEAIARLRAIPQLREQAGSLSAEAEGAAAQIAAFQAELETPGPDAEALVPGPDSDIAALEAAQAGLDGKLQAVRARLDAIGRQRVEQTARGEAIPAELAAALARLDEADDRLGPLAASPPNGAPGSGTGATQTQRLIFEADRDHAQAMIDKLEAERRFLKAIGPRRDLRTKIAEREAAALERARELLATRIASVREREAARQQSHARRAASDVPIQLEPLRKAALALSEENTGMVARLNAVEAELASTRTLAQQVADRDAQIRARAASAQGGSQIGLLLQRAKETLPDEARLRSEAARLDRESASLDDRAFELETQADDLPSTPDGVRAYLLSELNIPDPTNEQISSAQSLFELQRQANRELQLLIAGPDKLMAQVQELAAAKSELAVRVELLLEFVNARILWVRSDPAINRVPWRSALHGFDALIDTNRWTQLWAAARSRGTELIIASVAAPAMLVTVIVASGIARRRVRAINERVRHSASDGLRLTILAVALLAVRAGAIPALMVGGSWLLGFLVPSDRQLSTWLSVGLERAALPVFAGSLLILLCRQGGVGQSHFRWSSASVAFVAFHLRWFVPLVTLVAFVVSGARASGGIDANSLLRFVGPIALLISAAFFGVLLRPSGSLMQPVISNAMWGGWRYLWPVLYFLIVGSFVSLAGLHLLGWTFSVRVLTGQLFDTAIVAASLVLVRAIVLRWLAIERRRLAFEQYRKKLELLAKEQEKQAQAGEENAMVAPPDPPPEIELGSIQRQTRQLLNLGLWAAGLMLVIPIWQEAFPAAARIDEFRLLPISVAGGETTAALRDSGRYVLSAADLLTALIVGFVGIAAIRNVPPLIDGFVLSRSKLDLGARYAVTTIARYLLVSAVALMFLSALGFSGKSLGWAVAGLSVGMGLGLQEFVGNFVAGISLLFERTVRPGDWVTVGGVEGIVKSLSIRATVLTDFDRRDVVIPNRTLISEIVVNYTRTDITGRAIIKIGVAYGSDTRLVEQLLSETVKGHPLVEDALITFDSFGDSALNFTVRIYLKDVSQRLAAVNEIHHQVAAVFRRSGIEISFPQRDLHVRDGALEVRLVHAEASALGQAEK
jgi:potassium efflux system protein